MPKSKKQEHPYGAVPEGADLSHLAEGLRHLAVPLDLLTPDPANPRLHNERNLESIRNSLRRFGQDQPLVVQKEGLVVRKGNGRLEAARQLGWQFLAAVIVDEETIRSVERGIADNRSAELAEWDYQTLATLMRGIKDAGGDLTELGWETHEYEPLLQAQWHPPAVDDSPGSDRADWAKPVALTKDQREAINRAIRSLRQREGNQEISEGRCLELICVEWHQDPNNQPEAEEEPEQEPEEDTHAG